MLAAYLHTLDPWAIELSEGVGVRWYGLSYLFGFLLAYLAIRLVIARGVTTLNARDGADLVLAVAAGIMIGGRLGYCVFYMPELLGIIDEFPYVGLLAFHMGGMASHGGIAGALIAATIWARLRGHRVSHAFDLLVFSAPLGLFFGRLANFVNGELYGRACDPDFPLAVKFPQELAEIAANPVGVYRLQPVLAVLAARKEHAHNLVEAAVQAVQAGDPEIIRLVEPILTPRHPSQIYQALLEGLIVFLVGAWIWRRPKPPLLLTGWFMIGYSVMRIVGEQFREPDAHLRAQEFAAWHVTRGQLLSVTTLVAGGVFIACALALRRRGVPPMGGWLDRGGIPADPSDPCAS